MAMLYGSPPVAPQLPTPPMTKVHLLGLRFWPWNLKEGKPADVATQLTGRTVVKKHRSIHGSLDPG